MNHPSSPQQQKDLPISVVPRHNLQNIMIQAIVQAIEMRGKLLATAGNLQQLRQTHLLAAHQLRLVTLGKIPAEYEGIMPTEEDLEHLNRILNAVAELAGACQDLANMPARVP